jgi:hypothetical protein
MEYSVLAQVVGGKIRFDLQACPLVDILKKKKNPYLVTFYTHILVSTLFSSIM